MTPNRPSARSPDQMRDVSFQRNFTRHAEGSVLVSFGHTRVLCTASVDERPPPWLRGTGEGFLAPRSRYDEVVEALADVVGGQKVGDPSDPEVEVGPVVAERQRDRIEGYLDAGRAAGARVVVGGGRPAGHDTGWFIEPTVFADVDNSMTIAREEIFGPVVSVIPYEGVAEAVRIANGSDYGLSGSVWTGDQGRGISVAKSVRTGTYAVDSSMVIAMNNPFGGFKSSGVGRELGTEGVESYTETQTIVLGG